jgi:hypothetical protein
MDASVRLKSRTVRCQLREVARALSGIPKYRGDAASGVGDLDVIACHLRISICASKTKGTTGRNEPLRSDLN